MKCENTINYMFSWINLGHLHVYSAYVCLTSLSILSKIPKSYAKEYLDGDF
jgi:hypothetical protein